MRDTDAGPDRFEMSVAVAFATVAVLGTLIVVLTVALYLASGDVGAVPLP